MADTTQRLCHVDTWCDVKINLPHRRTRSQDISSLVGEATRPEFGMDFLHLWWWSTICFRNYHYDRHYDRHQPPVVAVKKEYLGRTLTGTERTWKLYTEKLQLDSRLTTIRPQKVNVPASSACWSHSRFHYLPTADSLVTYCIAFLILFL